MYDMNVIIYLEAIMLCVAIIFLSATFVLLGLSGRMKMFLGDSVGVILWIIRLNKFRKKDENKNRRW